MLNNETTAYVLAAILVFIIGLILFCCCRIWYDLLGCNESRRRQELNPNGIIITDNEESRFKPDSSDLVGDLARPSNVPVMRIVITKADDDEDSNDNEDQELVKVKRANSETRGTTTNAV